MSLTHLQDSVTATGRWLPAAVLLTAVAFVLLSPTTVTAQVRPEVTPDLLEYVLPAADRFGPKRGEPPVFEGFRIDNSNGNETLVGYAFLTSDVPPEERGYNGPIDVLVGMDLEGTLTGVEVISYLESLRESRGDFLRRPSFQLQFGGKHITDVFRLRQDVDGITGATITVAAMATGIRNASRRVARAHLGGPGPDESPRYIGTIDLDELDALSWEELFIDGLARQLLVPEGDSIRLSLSLVYLREPAIGEMLLGSSRFQEGIEGLGTRSEEDHLMMFGLSGPDSFVFQASTLLFAQGSDTISVSAEDFSLVGLLTEGKVQRQVRRAGLLSVDRDLDPSRPFEIVLDLSPEGGVFVTEYAVTGQETVLAANPNFGGSDAEPSDPVQPPLAVENAGSAVVESIIEAEPAETLIGLAGQTEAAVPPSSGPADDLSTFLFSGGEEDETVLETILGRTSVARVGGLLALLGLVTWAFLGKGIRLRWVTLATTFLLLGFVDGGFLSVSHIIAGISVGPGVYLADIPLLLLVMFTLITTLLWGRVFCGFLCPFGALQDFLEWIVPEKLRRELPRSVHERALLVKYPILILVLAPALAGGGVSLFHYFEPFGTVFYWSASPLLWTIAIVFLGVSAIVPRFYCRYVCPLGAALAISSLLSPFRIRRVEQCNWCRVCEQKCPTGAIHGPNIDFKECVRCNICEIQLIERAGACGHEVEEIRQKLVKLPMAGAEGSY